MRTTPPTIRPIKHGSSGSDCLLVDHVRWQPQTLYNSTQLQEGLDTDLNVYTIGTVWNMCDRGALTQREVARVLGLASDAPANLELRPLADALAAPQTPRRDGRSIGRGANRTSLTCILRVDPQSSRSKSSFA